MTNKTRYKAVFRIIFPRRHLFHCFIGHRGHGSGDSSMIFPQPEKMNSKEMFWERRGWWAESGFLLGLFAHSILSYW